jgi:hypothetical protein
MSIFRKRKGDAILERLVEEELFRLAHEEYSEGIIRDGLWAKSLAICDGDNRKAKGKYLQLRVQSMHDDAFLIQEIEKFIAKQQSEGNFKQPLTIESDQNSNEGPPGKSVFGWRGWAGGIFIFWAYLLFKEHGISYFPAYFAGIYGVGLLLVTLVKAESNT